MAELTQLLYEKLVNLHVVHKLKYIWNNYTVVRYSSYVTGTFLLNRIYRILHRKMHNYPPGQYGVPFVGSAYALALTNDITKYYIYISNAFGPISMSYFGVSPIVFINDLNLLQEIFKDQRLLWRGDKLEGTGDPKVGRTGSINNTNGDLGKFRRQVTHKAFSLLTNSEYIGKRINNVIAEIIYPEMDKFAESHNKYYCRLDLKYSMFTFLFVAIFGDILEVPAKTDKEFIDLLHFINELFQNMKKGKIINYFFGKNNFISSFLTNEMNINGARNNTFLLVRSWVQKYKSMVFDDNILKNSQDCYVKRMMKYVKYDQDQTIHNVQQLSWNNIYSDATTLFMTALHITLAQMESVLLFAAKYSGQQELVYEELQLYYRKNNIFDTKDIRHLNVFRAFIYEVMRFNGVVPHTLPRKINCGDLKINGYNIPYGATVIGNSTAIMKSPKYWKNPYIFDFNHFIDNKTGRFIKPGAFLTFGFGKRSCVGENFALRELYAVLAPLLYRYKFSKPNNEKWNIEKNLWGTTSVKQLPLIIEMR